MLKVLPKGGWRELPAGFGSVLFDRPLRDASVRGVVCISTVDVTGAPIVDLGRFKEQWNESFQFSFIDPAKLTKAERAIFDRTGEIMGLRGGRPSQVREILISKTMRLGASSYAEAAGVWEPAEGRIVVKRDQLRSLEAYAGTLLHEVAHAVSGTSDVSAAFEEVLTSELGGIARRSIDPAGGTSSRGAAGASSDT